MRNNNSRFFHKTLHFIKGIKGLPLTKFRNIFTKTCLHYYPFGNYFFGSQVINIFYKSVKRLFMCSDCYKNHLFLPLKYTTQILCIGINFLHFLPLHNKPVSNRINKSPCQCRLMYSVKNLYVHRFYPHTFSDIKKRYSHSCTGRYYHIRSFYSQNFYCKKRISDQCSNISVGRIAAIIHTFAIQKTSGTLFVECYPESVML